MRKRNLLMALSTIFVLAFILLTARLYISFQLGVARANYGVYPTPEQGMSALLGYEVEAQYIMYSGPSRWVVSNPLVWFVHVAGNGRGGGAYFVHTRDGWVHMQESTFPDFIGLGMLLFGLTP